MSGQSGKHNEKAKVDFFERHLKDKKINEKLKNYIYLYYVTIYIGCSIIIYCTSNNR